MIRLSLGSTWLPGVAAACALVIAVPAIAAHAVSTSAAKARTAAASAPPGSAIVAYESLEQQVGAEIAIETTLNTIRRGTLVKYTNPTLTLQLGPEHGSIDLSVPRETIRSIRLLSPAPAAPSTPGVQPDTGSTGAKKN